MSKKTIEKAIELEKKLTKMYEEKYSTWTIEALQFEYFSTPDSFINPKKKVLKAIILEKLNKKN